MWDKLKFKSLLLTGRMYMYHIAGYISLAKNLAFLLKALN